MISREISQKPAIHLSIHIVAFLLVCFFVSFKPATGYAVNVTLAWDANTEPDLAGYRIYHRQEGHLYDYRYPIWEGIETTCIIYNLDDTVDHYFVARAFDLAWNESPDSMEVSFETSIDTDGDGIQDSDEVSVYGTDPAESDTDHDGISDGEELVYWGSDWLTDWDGDGLNNLLDSDSDNDGMPDGAELREALDPSDPTSIAKLVPMEIGEVRVDHNWKYIAFSHNFQDPVVVAKSLSSNDGEPAVARMRNIDSSGFEIRVQEWDYLDGTHGKELVSYLALERGVHTLPDGTMVEAQQLETNITNGFTQVDFTESFPVPPVIVTAVTSYNAQDAVTTRMQSVTIDGFQVGMEEQELNAQSHDTETISYIAWQPSSGTIDGLTFEVDTTPDEVTHHLNTIVYRETFQNLPVFMADMQTTDGGDTSNVRWQTQDLYAVDLKIAEEQSSDSEIDHTTEVVGYMLLSTASDTDTPDDNCPDDPTKTEPGICGCGVADADTDIDGTFDCNDGCPSDNGKVDPGTCGCGVPDTDSDNDGTADCNDGCPDDPNKTVPGICGCGLVDADSDGDGTTNCNDGCPNDPAKAAPGTCGCGQADIDSDGDGTADCLDNCPDDPNKTEPGICGCGVPGTDSDGDGTPDCSDDCPNDPAKIAAGTCGCGQADIDSDGDGTLDCFDNCPDDPIKTEPGICGCGVVDVDTDVDGTFDCNDGCPLDPNKTEAGMCGCGVTDADTDGDGLTDCFDGCADDPDKTESGVCGCGVPDTDTDNDGTPDCEDGCPDDPNKTTPGAWGCNVSWWDIFTSRFGIKWRW